MTEHTPDAPRDDDNLDSPPGMFAAAAAEAERLERQQAPTDRPLTADDIVEQPEPEQPEHDPALVGRTALESILATDPTITIGEGDATQAVRLRFDLLALAELEKRYGSVVAPMLKLAEAAKGLDTSAPTDAMSGDLIQTVIDTTTIAAGRSRITVPAELREGAAGAPVMPSRVKVKDHPGVFAELLADGPETFFDLLVKVVAAFTASFGGAEGNALTANPGASSSPGGTGGTSPSPSFTSDPAISGA